MSVGDNAVVVIPCLNEEAHLPGLIAQLLADNPQRLIAIADGGSRDRSRAIVAEIAALHPNVVLMDNPDRIQSAGVNRAVNAFGAGRRWLVRVDAHCVYPDGYVSGLIATAERIDAISVVVPMITVGDSCFQRACAAAQNSVLGTGGSAHRHLGEGKFVEHGHHALMAIDAFGEVGGYNEAMSHNEDAELDHRLARKGRIWLEPAHSITYSPRRTPRALWRQYFGYGRGRAQTIELHNLRPRVRQLLPLGVPAAVGLALLAPVSAIFMAPLFLWIATALTMGTVIAIRARSACALLAGVVAMIMHLAWGLGFLRQWLFGRRPKEVGLLRARLEPGQ